MIPDYYVDLAYVDTKDSSVSTAFFLTDTIELAAQSDNRSLPAFHLFLSLLPLAPTSYLHVLEFGRNQFARTLQASAL